MTVKSYINNVTKYWHSYKYRFVPWLIFNMKNRKLRSVEKGKSDEIISSQVIFHQMCDLIENLANHIPYIINPIYEIRKKQHNDALKIMEEIFGFYVIRDKSTVAGTGVFVRRNKKCSDPVCVRRGQLLALYPGTLYERHHAIFFQSVANPYIFKCANNTLIDGSDRGISRIIFRSCLNRDQCGYYPIADDTWMSEFPVNPLNVGQYVNNQSKEYASNVVYQEFIYAQKIGLQYLRFIPYLWYSRSEGFYDDMPEDQTVPLTFVCIVASRDLQNGEELFSDYFTIIR